MKNHTIIHFFPTFGLGGQQRRFAELIGQFNAPMHHHVISLTDEHDAKDLIADQEQLKITTLSLEKMPLTSFANLQKLRKLFREHTPDLICTYNWGAIEAVIASHSLPFFASKTGFLHFEDGFGPDESPTIQNPKRIFARRILLRNRIVIVPSKTLENIAMEQWQLLRENIRYVPNGIDTERFLVSGRDYSQKPPVVVGTVGAFRKEKNLHKLISLFDRKTSNNAAKLYIYGDGPEMESLTDAAQNTATHNDIFLPGSTAHPEREYKKFDIFVLTSDTEQMPISLIEAMMAGLPVVSTRVGDVMDMVSEENRPFICSVDDDNLLLESLERLIDDPQLRAKLGRANQQKALEKFDRQAMVKTYEELFLSQMEN